MSSAHQTGKVDSTTVIKDPVSKMITLNIKALNIVWGGKQKYWKRGKEEDFEFAELIGVYWLEISGRLPCTYLDPGSYKLYFVIKLNQKQSGWVNNPVSFKLRLSGIAPVPKKMELNIAKYSVWTKFPEDGIEFNVPQKKPSVLTFSMYEIECEVFKTGLLVKEVVIEPRNNDQP